MPLIGYFHAFSKDEHITASNEHIKNVFRLCAFIGFGRYLAVTTTKERIMKGFKTTKLVVGIIMIVLSVVICIQASLVGVGNTIAGGKTPSGTAGIMVALLYLASGIVMIATRNHGIGGDIANLIMLVIAWIVGLANVGIYSDLTVWSWLAFIIGVGAFIWAMILRAKEKKATPQTPQGPQAPQMPQMPQASQAPQSK
jgi:hypothetical protein